MIIRWYPIVRQYGSWCRRLRQNTSTQPKTRGGERNPDPAGAVTKRSNFAGPWTRWTVAWAARRWRSAASSARRVCRRSRTGFCRACTSTWLWCSSGATGYRRRSSLLCPISLQSTKTKKNTRSMTNVERATSPDNRRAFVFRVYCTRRCWSYRFTRS